MSKPRPGLGEDWMDDVLGTEGDDPQRTPPAPHRPASETGHDQHVRPASTRSTARTSRSSASARSRPTKGRVTVGVDAGVLERARNAVWQLAGPPEHLTMAELVEQAIRREVERLEVEHNSGEPFLARSQPLRPGRPLGRSR